MATTMLMGQVKKDAKTLSKAKEINQKAKNDPHYKLALKLQQQRSAPKSSSSYKVKVAKNVIKRK